ncbi:hypothetical protein LEP1GSC047_4211 [Leptospira inadai serovar Lyme str. 10]|uniref:Activator of Hsp90 ATPase homologue 1/2-like C-terminal domain-containing protein n=2 Tax=Leptospira inadai serovar Lyme TaxID=293084 RepID=V6HEW0_9LEPT|nr:SRPBCC domain-containing protein [Leptospira inadai]EQA37963.1 hypothetical protein LEP1GSC047_4211 [Leptospira inadai serovar Lyme str. 10]PNV73612.1 SRPBCC domain-containing protein [Leptospira inadai serovar Lyme]
MNQEFVIKQITVKASVSRVWKAITNTEEMKKWYFDIPAFKPEVGFEFRFSAGSDENKYVHLCKITEVVEGSKITYSWRYEGYSGESYVTFELFPEGDSTRIRLTHSGLETFPRENPDLKRDNFVAGWTQIIETQLKEFLDVSIGKS